MKALKGILLLMGAAILTVACYVSGAVLGWAIGILGTIGMILTGVFLFWVVMAKALHELIKRSRRK